ncbi:hypothetical protein GCM10020331_032660 [Ectobacillus funiculus]
MTHYTLVSHLRMEGKYRLQDASEPVDKHTHVRFQFTDGTELHYNDVRKFGTMHMYKKRRRASLSVSCRFRARAFFSDELTAVYLMEKAEEKRSEKN